MESNEPASNPTCVTCGAPKSEHFNVAGQPLTRHVFTEVPGQLVTHGELNKHQPLQPILRAADHSSNSVGRLVEVLLDAKLIRVEDAIYIAGMGSKPNPVSSSSFADPTLPFGGH